MIKRVEGGLIYNQTLDAEYRLISVTVSGQTTRFIYDGDGNLVKRSIPITARPFTLRLRGAKAPLRAGCLESMKWISILAAV